MRKWMRERLQRRKKKPTGPAEPAEAPLQPAYFDEAAPASSPEAPREPEAQVQAPPDTESSSRLGEHIPPAEEPAQRSRPAQTSGGGTGQRGRGGRRRGGRGRSGRGREQAVAQAFTPAGIKGPSPERAEEESPVVTEGEGEIAAVPPTQAPKLP